LKQPSLNLYAGIPKKTISTSSPKKGTAKRKDVEALYLQAFSSERPITRKALQIAHAKLQLAFDEHAAKTESIFDLLEMRNLVAVRILLKNRPTEASARSPVDSMTPLIFSSYMGSLEAVKLLLNQKGTDVNAREENGATALYAASQQGYEAVVLALIERGASLNIARNDGDLPLTVACQQGNVETLKILREKGGADINEWTRKRQTNCLITACLHGRDEIVTLALSWGANVNAESEKLLTPLISACGRGHVKTAQLILQNPQLNPHFIERTWGISSPWKFCEQKFGLFAEPRLSDKEISRGIERLLRSRNSDNSITSLASISAPSLSKYLTAFSSANPILVSSILFLMSFLLCVVLYQKRRIGHSTIKPSKEKQQ